jgi:acyl-CoA dehydrogenase
MTYRAPVSDIFFALNHVAGISRFLEDGTFGDLDAATVEAVLEEAGKFAAEELSPLNRLGDEHGAKLVNGEVVSPPGWAQAYRKFWEGGWNALQGPAEFGGQGLPIVLSMAVNEMWQGANMAFALNPLLTQAGVEALHKYGSEELKAKYLPKMVSGEWTGTMQLTEPQSGSDLRFLKTRAVPQGDGTYKLTGTKIFITYGEHQLAENIIHIVLARLPDAPEGTKGISLFLVPKFLVGDDGLLGARNDVRCTKLEHKIGIHASPTCVINHGDDGGSVGYLIGEPNRGLFYMFTMMNQARLAMGAQGTGLAEHAYQDALAYAKERKQGAVDGTPAGQMAPIIEHPDVRRMLLSMKAKIAAVRAISTLNALAIDLGKHGKDANARAKADALAALLTPVSKAYGSDMAVEVASEAIQVHGGMGFIEETGVGQHYRDARIIPIYEGANGIQHVDLVTRKLPINDGQFVRDFIAELKDTIRDIKASNEPAFGAMGACLDEAVSDLEETTEWLMARLADNKDAALAGATAYGRLFAHATGGVLLGRGALAALRDPGGAGRWEPQIAIARHYAETQAPLTGGLKQAVYRSHDTVMGRAAELAFG